MDQAPHDANTSDAGECDAPEIKGLAALERRVAILETRCGPVVPPFVGFAPIRSRDDEPDED